MGARVTNRKQLSTHKKNKKQRKKNNTQRVIIKGITEMPICSNSEHHQALGTFHGQTIFHEVFQKRWV